MGQDRDVFTAKSMQDPARTNNEDVRSSRWLPLRAYLRDNFTKIENFLYTSCVVPNKGFCKHFLTELKHFQHPFR